MMGSLPDTPYLWFLLAFILSGGILLRRKGPWATRDESAPKAILKKARPLEGLVRDGQARPARENEIATASQAARPDAAVARTLARTCDETHRDVSLPGRQGAVRIPHVARRDGIVIVAQAVRMDGRLSVRDDGSWTPRGGRPTPDPISATRLMAEAAEAATGGTGRVFALTVNVGKATFDGRTPQGFVHLGDLEDTVVALSDGHRGSVAAEEAMAAIRAAAVLSREAGRARPSPMPGRPSTGRA